MSENITISKTELVQLFKKVYEEGWYGSKDMAEVVAAKAVEDIDSETVKGVFTKELVNEANGYYVGVDPAANDIRGPGRANRTQHCQITPAGSSPHWSLATAAHLLPLAIPSFESQSLTYEQYQAQFQWPDPPSNADVSETVVVDESQLESGELPSADVPDEIRQMTNDAGWHII